MAIRQEDAPKGEEKVVQDFDVNGGELSLNNLDTKASNVEIPGTIAAADGKKYTVKKVGKSAMSGNTTLETIKLPMSVDRIMKEAMWGCMNLTSLIFGERGFRSVKETKDGTVLVASNGSKITLEKNCLKGTSKKLTIEVETKADKKAVKKQLKKAGNKHARVKVGYRMR